MARLAPLNLRPDKRALRVFGAVTFVVAGALAANAFYNGTIVGVPIGERRTLVVGVLTAIAVMSGLFSCIAPSYNRPLYAVLSVITYPIGLVLGEVLLVLLFFVVLGPFALILRATGWDPLGRCYDRTATTYWKPVKKTRDRKSYFEQY